MNTTDHINTIAEAIVCAVNERQKCIRLKALNVSCEAERGAIVRSLRGLGHRGEWDGEDLVILIGFVRRA